MINQPNTIYEIRYDFDLNGETINVPENCTLKFNGGSLNNGILNLNSTKLLGDIKIFTKVIGSPCTEDLYITWFGANTNEDFDNSPIIQMLVDLSPRITVIIPNGTFGIKSPILFDESTGFLKGTSSRLSILKATAKMDCMLTQKSTAKYATPALSDFSIDGNLDGTISNDLSFTSNATCGIKFNDYWYTYCHDLRITNIAGIALDFNNIWNVELTRIYISNCYVGFRLGLPNGESINNCEFVRIKYFGIVNKGSANINITENIFESIGYAAIYTAGGYTNISGNYFENTSETGFKIGNYDNTNVVYTIHCSIFIEPRYQDYDKDIFYNGGSTPGLTTVSSNSFQEFNHNYVDTSTEKYCLIYCGGCNGLNIVDNLVHRLSSTLLGCKLNNGVRVKNVSIKNNIRRRLNPDGFPIDDSIFTHIEVYDNSDDYGYIYNVTTDSDVISDNLANDLSISSSENIGFSELNEYYKGDRVYCNNKSGFSLNISPKDPNNISVTDKTYTGWFLAIYNIYNTSTNSWISYSKVYNSVLIRIFITKGYKFTMPKIYYLEANKKISDWTPRITSSGIIKALNIKYLKGTSLILIKDPIYKAALFIDDDNNYELIRKDGVYTSNPQNIIGRYTWDEDPFVWIYNNRKKRVYFDEQRSLVGFSHSIHNQSVLIELNSCKAIKLLVFMRLNNGNYIYFELLIYIENNIVKYDVGAVFGDTSLILYGISSDFTKFYISSVSNQYGTIHIEYFGMNISADEYGNVPDREIQKAKMSIVTTPTNVSFTNLPSSSGVTNKRPTNIQSGFFYFDSTLNKPIWWTGTKWVDATGADV